MSDQGLCSILKCLGFKKKKKKGSILDFFYKSMQFGSSIPAASWPFDSEVGKKTKQRV